MNLPFEAINSNFERGTLHELPRVRCRLTATLEPRSWLDRPVREGDSIMKGDGRFKTTHGFSKTAVYRAWGNMWSRCYNPNYTNFHLWGGRGISVCDHWAWFENFYNDMGPQPYPGATVERLETTGNYEPSNCLWASRLEQSRNTRQSKIWTIESVEYPSAHAAASALGVSADTILRWCDGKVHSTNGVMYGPRQNCFSRRLYDDISTRPEGTRPQSAEGTEARIERQEALDLGPQSPDC